jgi:hypothetical protein
MKVEERAKSVTDEIGTTTTGAEIRALIAQALRNQIEDCAKVLDRQEKEKTDICARAEKSGFRDQARGYALQAVALMHAAEEIRALAAPTEKSEGKEVERWESRHKL